LKSGGGAAARGRDVDGRWHGVVGAIVTIRSSAWGGSGSGSLHGGDGSIPDLWDRESIVIDRGSTHLALAMSEGTLVAERTMIVLSKVATKAGLELGGVDGTGGRLGLLG